MRGLRFDGHLAYHTDLPLPRRPEGEALIRVRRAGICRTDLEIVRGYMGFIGIPGHEFVGEVMETAEIGALSVGTRVVGEINAACQRCPACASGQPRHCPRRSVLGIVGRDGAFAEYLTLPVANLHPVPDPVSDDAAVFVEPLAAAYRILEQVEIASDLPVAVLGDGRLGHLVAMVLQDAGAATTMIGHHPERLERLRELGIKGCCPEAHPATRYPVTVECTGHPEGLAAAIRLTHPTGTLVLKSTYEGRPPLELAPLVIDEIRVVGSRCGPFEPALTALAEGRLPVTDLIAHRFPLSRGVEAFEAARGSLKVLLEPD